MKRVLVSLMTVALFAALAVPASANFTPSVESKPAPEVVVADNAAAVIKDSTGKVVESVSVEAMCVTPASKKDEAKVGKIAEGLAKAEAQIKNAANVGELTADLAPALEKANVQGVEIKDLVVRDLFDVSVVEDNAAVEIAAGQTITFTLKTDLTKTDLFFVLHNYVDDKWEVVENVTLDDKGNLSITLDGMSPIAIVVDEAAHLDVDPSAPSSPQTGETLSCAALMSTVAFLAAAAFLCMKATKRV